MGDAQLIAAATTDDIAHFARTRCRDEHARKLYVDLAQTAPRGAYVAKDSGTPIGIGFAHALEDEWFLSELYVEPSFRAQGIGGRLLEEVAKDAGDVSRTGLLQSGELGSVAFYLQRSVPVQTPVAQIAGTIPHENELARMAAGEYRFITEPIEPLRHRAALAGLDREVRGSARPLDHAYFCENGRGVIFRRDEELAGYAYAWPSGRIGPLAAASQTYVVQFFAFALATLARTFEATWCTALVPATNVRVMRAALRAQLKIETLGMFASDAGMLDLSRYVGFHGLLF